MATMTIIAAAMLAAAAPAADVPEADEQGNVVIPEGTARRRDEARKNGKDFVVPEENGWLATPLGAPGDLKVNTDLPNKPIFRPRRQAAEGLLLFGGPKDAVIVCQHGPVLQRPMNELRYHLEQMIGREVKVVTNFPKDGEPALTVRYCDGDAERSVVRVEDGVVSIEGRDASGLSHALTYFLEAVGCRYLWPGKGGKVIPRKSRVAVPEGLSLDFTPTLKIRRIRDYNATHERRVTDSACFGFDALKVLRTKRLAGIDHADNRTFWQWHGLNDSIAVPGDEPNDDGKIRWEHRFNDYAERFFDEHPDWFALQPDGRRRGDARPTFCLSSDGLAEQVAKETIEMFRGDMSVQALSMCFPDGGYMSWCHCEACRRLDPVNASPITLTLYQLPQGRETRPYVAYTDRVLNFYNRVAAKVKAELPDKMLSMYAYSHYEAPPVKERPDPCLIVLTCAGGSYQTEASRESARRSVAAWGTFGNKLLWRPNALAGYRAWAPVNFARWLFDDVETFKANGLIGTDFDCMSGEWATDGFMFYMLAKAHLNPDRLSYDDIAADYCEAAFGAGAEAMKRYFAALERHYAAVAARRAADLAAKSVSALDRRAPADAYMRTLDLDALSAILDDAEAAATGDGDALARIAFVRRGVSHGRMERRMAEAVWSGSPDRKKKASSEFKKYVRQCFLDDPVSISPNNISFYDLYLVK